MIYFFITANIFAHFLLPSLAKPLCLKIIENAFPKLKTSRFCNMTLRHLVRCKGYLFLQKNCILSFDVTSFKVDFVNSNRFSL